MNLQRAIYAALIFAILGITGCKKNNKLGNLNGVWKLTSAFADGEGTSGSGTISFEESTGDMDISYVIGNDTLFRTGEFDYREDLSIVDINFPNRSFVWIRNSNNKKEQQFEVEEVIKGTNHLVTFDLELE